jgi:acyl-CoA synthetase (AMP-forming)/AMP-acid ligase II
MTAQSGKAPALDFPATTIGLLRRAAAHFPDRDFIVEPDARLTYAEADHLSHALARRLVRVGVGKGTRVAAKYPNGVQWAIAWLAVTRIGGFFMPLSSAYKTAEVRKCLRIGDAEFYMTPDTIIGRDQRAMVADLIGQDHVPGSEPLMLPELPYLRRIVSTRWGAGGQPEVLDISAPDSDGDAGVTDALLGAIEQEVTPADWMLAIFTSGSTSDPKCVVHTHGAPIRHGTAIVDINQWTQQDRIFAGMPFFWVGGNCYTVIPAMLAGAAVICMERFEPGAALDLMERESATRVVGWPGVINPLLEHPTLAARRMTAFTDPMWNPRIYEAAMTGLGMSETGSNHTGFYLEERSLPEARGTVGRAIPFIEHRIADAETGEELGPGETGNIQVRGYSVMAGYYKKEREDTFTPDGFFDTRDRGFLRDGYLVFAGRDVGLIKTAGNNVSALEVEAALREEPGVANAFVVGIEDEAVGQLVGAAIVPGPQGVDVDAVLASLRGRLSAYKVPRIVRVMAAGEVPFLYNGKLDFRALVGKIIDSPPA